MRARLIANPDAGARVVSDQIRTREHALGAYVMFVVFDPDSSFWTGLGDGSLVCCSLPGADPAGMRRIDLGVLPLCAAPGVGAAGVVVGTDDGVALAIGASGDPAPVGPRRGRWVERVASHPVSRLRAWAAGREVMVADPLGGEIGRLVDHPSTVTGLAFSPDGERLAAAHYDGVSIWAARSGNACSRSTGTVPTLPWHGAPTAPTSRPRPRIGSSTAGASPTPRA